MLRSLLLALALAVPSVPADYTECKLIENGPIHSEKPPKPFVRQPDFAALSSYPKTMIFDGMPPPRFRGPAVVTVSTGTVASCGAPFPGFVFEACVRGNVIHVPNPCDFPAEKFAVLLCHEIGHVAGWPADHGS